MIDLDKESFERVVKTSSSVFVDFWAEWCAPCRFIEPMIRKLAKKYHGKMLFSRVNVDKEIAISSAYQILSVPTFIVFKNGIPVGTLIGAVGEQTLDEFILRSLNSSV